jgi:predicted DNA-binding protein (UPF0251 family)
MRFHGLTNENLAQKLGITRSTFQGKLKKLNFSIKDVRVMQKEIPLSDEEVIKIFFK